VLSFHLADKSAIRKFRAVDSVLPVTRTQSALASYRKPRFSPVEMILSDNAAMQATLDAFLSIENERLSEVKSRISQTAPDALLLCFQTRSLLIQVDGNDDTIQVTSIGMLDIEQTSENLTSSSFWREFVGQPFGWGWAVMNQQGYSDGVLLSFGGVTPQVLLEVIASSLKTHRIGSAEVFGRESSP
jgi:hypothetical protein